ncbi:sex peptide receptor [Drosophila ficusphila]|uniref:sex peptide receptor n=1 Tax=Drosophila ficusphila TaxID=30025 RepID=UPI0007E77370|nr:sex peptide receptor [Drosophila ficusphila]XP_017054984.1 sex peptide receptor [Drosophila ficusphila]XP_017054985.1 sex peptide receptor [Drosophila ficusphila]XP_017054986.1 sex peptide receptor [Drosophila ficusphila]XP_017054987.1 sex peptide receptor [Drosophila ficusphila]XP_017054988.1 sex peptide receptor [Drosophila ficusphila]
MENSTDLLYQYRLAPSASPEMQVQLQVQMQMEVEMGDLRQGAVPHLPGNESQLLGMAEYGFGNGSESLDYPNYQQMAGGPAACRQVDNNVSYWNLTCDSPLDYAMPLYGYCMPFLMIITIISNSLIVLVLSKKSMATPTNFVLMGMAICDMLTVIFPAPGLWYMYTFGNHYKPLHPVSMCLAYSIFNEIMPALCHTISVWLTLALAVQRYIYVCHAPMARTWCTMPRVRRCTAYIALLALLHQLPRFFDRTYMPLEIEWNGEATEVCHLETALWVHEYIGVDLYYTSYYLFRVLFVHLLPCIILVTLNILLFAAMRQAQERRKLLFRENRKKECKKLRETNCTTLMLIVVVSVFLLAEIPIAVVTVMHIVSSLIIEFLDYGLANICIMLTNFFLVVSYPINFGIYCGMSRQFRETFKEIFLGRLMAKKDTSTKYSIVNGARTCTNTNETVL